MLYPRPIRRVRRRGEVAPDNELDDLSQTKAGYDALAALVETSALVSAGFDPEGARDLVEFLSRLPT